MVMEMVAWGRPESKGKEESEGGLTSLYKICKNQDLMS